VTKPERESDVTSAGSHYLKDWSGCDAKGAYAHFYPHPKMDASLDQFGLQPLYVGEALVQGSAIHNGLEEWYHSRIKDGEDTGEANIDRALEASDATWSQRGQQMIDQDLIAPKRAETHLVLRRYHDYYGQGGALQEYPNTKVYCDDKGEPWIEKQFEIDVGGGYHYTARIDLLVHHQGFLCAMDHKSSKASFAKRIASMAEMEAQFTGELLCIHDSFPDLSINGVIVNILVKDRRKGPPFDRVMVGRTKQELDLYRYHTRQQFIRIDQMKQTFQDLIDEGIDPDTAFSYAFPKNGARHDTCFAYYRQCEFWYLCKSPGLQSRLIASSMSPRRRVVDNDVDPDSVDS